MVTIRCSISSDCNKPLIMTHCYSNDLILRSKSNNLLNSRDLAHCAAWALSPSIWKLRLYFLGWGSFWPGLWVVLLYWYWNVSYLNKTGAFGAVTLWLFFWNFCAVIKRDICRSSFFVWAGHRFSLNNTRGFIFYRRVFTIMFICNWLLFTFDISVLIQLFMTIWSDCRCAGRIRGSVRLLYSFCLPSLCARSIPLTMVDELWYFVADVEIIRLKNIC